MSLNFQRTWQARILTNRRDKNWYLYVSMPINWKFTNFKCHRLVGIYFIPNPENKPQINHIDGNKKNNDISNLEWVTIKENHQHAYKTWLHKNNNFQNNHPHIWKFWKLNHQSKSVKQFSLDRVLIKTWWWMKEVERELWISHWNIWSCCRWLYKQSWWFIWEYA